MLRQMQIACVIALLLLNFGCQSSSKLALPIKTVECLPPPMPEEWFMRELEPNLTQRMLKELSPSQIMETRELSP